MSLFFATTFYAVAQQPPVISGDVMLCPDTNGTATVTNNVAYTTYQWYSKFWFDFEADFEPIAGATSSSFTYDWFTYDQSLLKVVVTLDGVELESNTIQIDSYAWTTVLVSTTTDGIVTRGDYPVYLICEGGSVINTVLSPYTFAQWYKDGVAIQGATNLTYTITEPGEYYVVAGVDVCPNTTSTSLHTVVRANPDCATLNLTPVINGDLTLCPNNDGVAFVSEGIITYDSYQWYASFNDGEFEAIEDATSDILTYNQAVYDQATFKLVVTQDEVTYESNTISIDTYTWAPLSLTRTFNENVTLDTENQTYLLCPGGAVTGTLSAVFTDNIQWYKDGEPIEGAYNRVYIITEPGSYYVEAAPATCPGNSSSTVDNPIFAALNTDCIAGVENPNINAFKIYPNPANSILNVNAAQITGFDNYAVYDITGKKLLHGTVDASLTAINVSGLSAGSYIVKLTGNKGQASKMFIKQ